MKNILHIIFTIFLLTACSSDGNVEYIDSNPIEGIWIGQLRGIDQMFVFNDNNIFEWWEKSSSGDWIKTYSSKYKLTKDRVYLSEYSSIDMIYGGVINYRIDDKILILTNKSEVKCIRKY